MHKSIKGTQLGLTDYIDFFTIFNINIDSLNQTGQLTAYVIFSNMETIGKINS